MLKMFNNKLLIEPITSMTSLGNGLQITNETQSRKDIVSGKVIDSATQRNWVGKRIFYPLYAANPIAYDGRNYHILDQDDILAYDSEDN